MKFQYRYYGQTTASHTDQASAFSFAPDTLRDPTHFVGSLKHTLAFREAMGALHAVVVSDMRTRGRDSSAYQAWLAENEAGLLARYMAESKELRQQADSASAELSKLRQAKHELLKPFYAARSKYFDWLYEHNRDLWYVLDPVVTVHPDSLLFEAFSQDESAYCAVRISHNLFDRVGEMACGTTNIDYSSDLAEEFQKLRDYKTTTLAVDPAGFGVATGDDPGFREEKIDLPDSWVRGFLQVTSAMQLPMTRLDLHPMDLHNLCAVLRQKKERAGPRSVRFELRPGQPVKLIIEPWNIELLCRRTVYEGVSPQSIRLWGRRRLLTLERLIPVADKISVHLLGNGMPSFWVAALPGITVTLGLSGWVSNDWSAAGRFDLLGPRQYVDDESKLKVLAGLARHWIAAPATLARHTGLDVATVEAALGLWVQGGRVVYDLGLQAYCLRELAREPLPLESLRYASPEEAQAGQIAQAKGGVKLAAITRHDNGKISLSGQVAASAKSALSGKQSYQTSMVLDTDERLIDGACGCNHYQQNKLRRGPCQHMLALRLVAQPELNAARETLV